MPRFDDKEYREFRGDHRDDAGSYTSGSAGEHAINSEYYKENGTKHPTSKDVVFLGQKCACSRCVTFA